MEFGKRGHGSEPVGCCRGLEYPAAELRTNGRESSLGQENVRSRMCSMSGENAQGKVGEDLGQGAQPADCLSDIPIWAKG